MPESRAPFVALFCALAAAGAASHAQDYPARPIRVIVPAAAGSPGDTVARAVAQKLTDAVGSTSAEFAAFLKSEVARWTKVAREANIQAD